MPLSTQIQTLLSRTPPTPYTAPPSLSQLSSLWSSNPTIPRTLILTCADPRCHAETIFNLNPSSPSDAAIVIRTQGGDFTTAIPAILAIDSLINFTDFIILKHTDCGSLLFRDEDIKQKAKDNGVVGAAEEVKDMWFGQNSGAIEDAVRRDLGFVKASKTLRKELRDGVVGMVFDLDTGNVSVVE